MLIKRLAYINRCGCFLSTDWNNILFQLGLQNWLLNFLSVLSSIDTNSQCDSIGPLYCYPPYARCSVPSEMPVNACLRHGVHQQCTTGHYMPSRHWLYRKPNTRYICIYTYIYIIYIYIWKKCDLNPRNLVCLELAVVQLFSDFTHSIVASLTYFEYIWIEELNYSIS